MSKVGLRQKLLYLLPQYVMKVFLDTGRQRKLLILYLFIWNIAADCPLPEHGEYTVLTNESLIMHEFPDGTVITHECRLGYVKTSGTGTSNCVNGKWTDPDIICKKQDCGPLEAKPHMFFDTSQGTLFGAIVKVTCEKGYWINGMNYRQCLGTRWFGRGDCVLVTCPIPTKVENGEHSWRSDHKPEYQQTIHFSCKTGYTLIGNRTIRCTTTGKYDSEPPQCIAYCPMPEGGKNMVLTDESLLRKDFPDGTKLTYKCSNGYEKESGSEIITCIGGNWTEPDLICKAYCPMPEGGKNMVLTDESLLRKDFPDGTKLTYKCNNGYEKESGSEIITCIGGNWTEPDLICKAYCPMPEGGKNIVLTDESLLRKDFPDGTNLTYECSNGYEKESGSENITCIGGNWTESDLICKAYCPMPKGGENLVLTDEFLLKKDFPDGTKVIYKCSNGFEKERGSENITCIDGNWTEPDLICKKQSIVETIKEGNTPPVAIFAIVCSIVGIFINICLKRR